MKNILAAVIAATLSTNVIAFGGFGDEDHGHFSISTGTKGGVYEQAGKVLKVKAEENGWTVDARSVQQSLGSYHNVARGAAGKLLTPKQAKKNPNKQMDLKYFFMQDDARIYYMKMHPEIKASVTPLGVVGEEVVHAVGRDGHITDEDGIDKGTKVCVDREGAGAKASMDTLSLLESSYKNATTVFKSRASALNDLSNNMGACDVVLFVSNPMNEYAAAYKDVAGYGNLEYFPLDDWSLTNKIDGRQPYTVRKIKVGYNGKRVKVKLPVTKVWLMANTSNTTPAERDAMTELALREQKVLFTPIK